MKYPPINPKYPHMLHGGDYNPDQWLHMPEILREDVRMMGLAGCNAMSIGIFAWTALEPEEGVFTFDWLDRVMDDLAAHDIYAVLATPSGARPAWMSEKYPEVLRMEANRVRNLHGRRHNHCFTSPVYREKVSIINTLLAERYKDHPALLVWHISNEYGGDCHCPLCQQAFRDWLQERYAHDLEQVNAAWNTSFWSHTYTSWSQIESPAPHGEGYLHGLNLDWKRFATDRTVDFMRHEAEPLRRLTPGVPVTTNMMGTYPGLNYWKFAPHVDVISWDGYPQWHTDSEHIRDGVHRLWPEREDAQLGLFMAFLHNLNRSLRGGQPFMLMESTPSMTNWQAYAKLKRPGMHMLSSLQAVAHGSDTVQYFQWRKSRGSSEKLHGAVVDHVGHEHTRVFHDVAELGKALQQLDPVVGAGVPAEVAIIFDWENRWALEDAQGPRNDGEKRYEGTCMAHAAPFWQRGIPFDVIDMEQDFANYKLLIAPMLYMVRPGVAERIDAFVQAGGTFVATYLSGWVDEHDLCFLGGFPGPLRQVLGLWSEEIDAIGVEEANGVRFAAENPLGLSGEYPARIFCDLIHTEGAQTLASYTGDFYAGRPAVTVHPFGQGQAYYLATRTDNDFLQDFYGALVQQLSLARSLETELPAGVTAHRRSDGDHDFIFVMNFTSKPQHVTLPTEVSYTDLLTQDDVAGVLELAGYGVRVITPA
ncbi:MAG TPA: beta-galactosidase [Armatimonadota bacterium]|jgi:beta-galactosidase